MLKPASLASLVKTSSHWRTAMQHGTVHHDAAVHVQGDDMVTPDGLDQVAQYADGIGPDKIRIAKTEIPKMIDEFFSWSLCKLF